ncbi:MAG TPA: hypothetical protein VHW44_18990, partial [Pseudonocardiaceae bacterium]|nr:hypothetical protein [Pseudonocardiaceae bacterium]
MTSELTWFRINTTAADGVLARVVVLLGTKGVRVHDLSWVVGSTGGARITTLVEHGPGRRYRLVGALSRVVDVLDIAV